MKAKSLYFLIGASGAGKTAAVTELVLMNVPGLNVLFFDRIGVASEREMIGRWGSGEAWQRAMTFEWVARMKADLYHSRLLLDGQTRPSFIAEACRKRDIDSPTIILLDCSDEVRTKRLLQRGQPELASSTMMHWARYLRDQTKLTGGIIIDNDHLSIGETAAVLSQQFNRGCG
jgi:hypothetical protein